MAGSVHAVLDRDQLRVAIDFEILRGIDFGDVQIFIDRFRFDVVLGTDFRRDFVPGRAGHDDADRSARRRIARFRSARFPAFARRSKVKRIERPLIARGSGMAELVAVRTVGICASKSVQTSISLRRIFRERNADGVAQAVAQQRADADGALDPAVFAFAGFGDAEVDRIIPVRAEFIQSRDQQAIALDHHLGIARLHREFEIMEIVLAADAGKFQRAFHHAQRRVAVTVHDAVAERAVIGADAQAALQVSCTRAPAA